MASEARGPGEASEAPKAYTIDELAQASGVPSRTIRFYQAKGALPPPEKQGRLAVYRDAHLERLRLVAELQDRGLHLRAIRDLLGRVEGGNDSLGDWLGLDERLRAPWSEDRPIAASEQELLARLGRGARPGLLADLVRADLVRPEGDARPPTYVIPSPGLLKIALDLEASGVDLEAAFEAERILRKRVGAAVDELVAHFGKAVERQAKRSPKALARSLEGLRSAATEALRLVFAQEIERALREVTEDRKAPPRKGPRFG